MSWHEPTLRDLVAEIEDVAADAARTLKTNALAQVLAFLTKVAHVLEQAYRDVIPVLIEIKFAPDRLGRDALDRMRQQIELLSARSRYRDAEEICSRLSTLRKVYEANVSKLIDAKGAGRWTGLFGLIEEREGRIIMLIQSQMRMLLETFDEIERQGGRHNLRELVGPSIKEITAQVGELTFFTNRILGLSGEPGMLEMLRDPATARSVVQQLTLFDRRQYVEHNYQTSGKNSPIIGAGASVTGGVANTTIGNMDLSALAQELRKLRTAMERESTGKAEQSIAIGKVAEAEVAATKDDDSGVASALKAAGKWTLGIAEKIGVDIVVAALKSEVLGSS